MASNILAGGEDEGINDTVIVGENSEAGAASPQAAERQKATQESKPQPPAGAAKHGAGGMSGLLADKGRLITYGAIGIAVVLLGFYLMTDDTPPQPKNTGGFASGARNAPPPASSP
ncbi:hypothetical protein, partial [Candidatus Erwinia dacicola]